MTRPYILAAPNGARRSRADHPEIPVTIPEIVDAAHSCFQAGAHGLHLHIRDNAGIHSLDPGRYREAIRELATHVPGMDIQITTESAGKYDVAAQLDCLRSVEPAWASISVREIARTPDLAETVYGACADMGTRVQHILYDKDDGALLDKWRRDGTIRPDQTDRLLVLGRYATGQPASIAELDAFWSSLAPGHPTMVCAFGPQEHICLRAANARGCDTRVGFENSLTNADGDPWPNNATSVATLAASLIHNAGPAASAAQ